jgi:NAD(P)-dependent dehydrogenase (short-subunit alcohol dehydrogenase family)
VSPRPLGDAVVVITGASSGIGRAAAVRFAHHGASVVLAARDGAALRDVAEQCLAAGGQAEVAPTDVTDEAAVQRLAARAVERFGRLDVWVNNAGVIMYGRFEDVSSDDFRRVIEGQPLRSGPRRSRRAPALPPAAQRGAHQMSSVWGRVASPQVSAYVTSKFAVRAFSHCLRYELADLPDVHVATILPQAVDTPIFDHAANHAGRRARPIPPLVDPGTVAEGILHCARDPRPEITYARSGRALELLHVALPRLYDRVAPAMFTDGSFAEAHSPEHPDGNLHRPLPGSVTGGWKDERRRVLWRALDNAITGGLRGLAGRTAGKTRSTRPSRS